MPQRTLLRRRWTASTQRLQAPGSRRQPAAASPPRPPVSGAARGLPPDGHPRYPWWCGVAGRRALPALPRRGEGLRRADEARFVRETLPRRFPERLVVAHHPAQACGLSARIRGFRRYTAPRPLGRGRGRNLLPGRSVVRHRGKIEATFEQRGALRRAGGRGGQPGGYVASSPSRARRVYQLNESGPAPAFKRRSAGAAEVPWGRPPCMPSRRRWA